MSYDVFDGRTLVCFTFDIPLGGRRFGEVPGYSDLPVVQTASCPKGVSICWSE